MMPKILLEAGGKTFLFAVYILFFLSCNRINIRYPVSVGDSYLLKATYYSGTFNGKKTASGEIYDDTKLTAAVDSFPIGAVLSVTNINNDKTVDVVVNDRAGKRVIDLSKAAFIKIANINRGVIKVRVRVKSTTKNKKVVSQNKHKEKKGSISSNKNNKKIYTIQLAVFRSIERAKEFQRKISMKESYIYFENKMDEKLYKLRLGNFEKIENAKIYQKRWLNGVESFIIALNY